MIRARLTSGEQEGVTPAERRSAGVLLRSGVFQQRKDAFELIREDIRERVPVARSIINRLTQMMRNSAFDARERVAAMQVVENAGQFELVLEDAVNMWLTEANLPVQLSAEMAGVFQRAPTWFGQLTDVLRRMKVATPKVPSDRIAHALGAASYIIQSNAKNMEEATIRRVSDLASEFEADSALRDTVHQIRELVEGSRPPPPGKTA